MRTKPFNIQSEFLIQGLEKKISADKVKLPALYFQNNKDFHHRQQQIFEQGKILYQNERIYL